MSLLTNDNELPYAEDAEIPFALEGSEPVKDSLTKSIRARFTRKTVCRTLVGACLVLIPLVLIAVSIGLFIGRPDECETSFEIPRLQDSLIHNTREYQITLDMSKIRSRTEYSQWWIKEWNKVTKYIRLEFDDLVGRDRLQHSLHGGVCGSDSMFRVRNYLIGNVSTTIDIKSNSKIRSRACSVPFWPADNFLDISSQKCEEDYHSDHGTKYSRETRFSFSEHREFRHCQDLAALWPWEFGNLRPYEWMIELDQHFSEELWYDGEIEGEVEGTKFKVALTLHYASEVDYTHERQPKSGEWSIRVYTENGGLSDNWNQKIVDDLETGWNHLIDLLA